MSIIDWLTQHLGQADDTVQMEVEYTYTCKNCGHVMHMGGVQGGGYASILPSQSRCLNCYSDRLTREKRIVGPAQEREVATDD